jgi:hypothetical protein
MWRDVTEGAFTLLTTTSKPCMITAEVGSIKLPKEKAVLELLSSV